MLLTTSDGNEVLFGIMPVANGSAAKNRILTPLIERHIALKKIAAYVFDTTAINRGKKTGIVKRLEYYPSQLLEESACRHHTYKMVCRCG